MQNVQTDELAALNANICQLNIQRRQVLNDFLDLKGTFLALCPVHQNYFSTATILDCGKLSFLWDPWLLVQLPPANQGEILCEYWVTR